jgi:SAM-dependent methyltransferase
MQPEETIHDAASVREFFDGWSLYRKIVDLDYLHHRGVRVAFSQWLDGLETQFSFLDLGCGDAEFSAGLLRGRQLSNYTGVDLSSVALGLAARNLTAAGIPHDLHQGDFTTALESLPGTHDLIYVGLSLHHLLAAEKKTFLAALHGKLAPGGFLLIYDPVRLPGETREDYMSRWVARSEKTWRALTPEELGGAIGHVTSADFPEEIDSLQAMGVEAGFKKAEVLFKDPDGFYALMAFRITD